MNSTTKWTIRITLFVSVLVLANAAKAQQVENATLWEVSGNGLSKPSYLFGTFHLKGKSYIDSLKNVTAKLYQSEAIVGELLLDSTANMKVLSASVLHGTTLDKLLTPEAYAQTASWLKELSGFDLRMFNSYNPMMVQITLMLLMQQKHFAFNAMKETPMDMYFQKYGKTSGKPVSGLETIDVQIHALYQQFTVERQAEMLTEFVTDKAKAYKEMVDMNKYYKEGNLAELEKLMASGQYSEEEGKVMLDNRNLNWAEQLPAMFKTNSSFVAVGALHLPGKNGLVNLLRKKGFTVKPLPNN